MRVTRRDAGRGLSNTNLESRHSCLMKLLSWKTEGEILTQITVDTLCIRSHGIPTTRHEMCVCCTRGAWHLQSARQWRCQCVHQRGGSSSGEQPALTGLAVEKQTPVSLNSPLTVTASGSRHTSNAAGKRHTLFLIPQCNPSVAPM